jgi:hypothetical protein
MNYTVHGYLDGVSYALVADSTAKDELRGIVTQGPVSVIAAVESLTGQRFPLTPTSAPVEVSLTDPLGLLAGLAQATQITSVEGDMPDGWPDKVADSERVAGPVDY